MHGGMIATWLLIGLVLLCLSIAAIGTIVATVIRRRQHGGPHATAPTATQGIALAYARGEITRTQFLQAIAALRACDDVPARESQEQWGKE